MFLDDAKLLVRGRVPQADQIGREPFVRASPPGTAGYHACAIRTEGHARAGVTGQMTCGIGRQGKAALPRGSVPYRNSPTAEASRGQPLAIRTESQAAAAVAAKRWQVGLAQAPEVVPFKAA